MSIRFLRTVLMAALMLAPADLAAQVGAGDRRGGTAILGGRIVDHETGRGLTGATATLSSGEGDRLALFVRTSDADGRFEFRDVSAGRYSLTVEVLGYLAFIEAVEVGGGTDVRMEIRMSASPLDLDPIIVVTARRPDFMDGFEERRARERVHTAFFTAAEIEARHPRVVSDLFAATPGAYVEPGLMSRDYVGHVLRVAGTPAASALRGSCLPDVWVDGILNNGVAVDEMYRPEQIEAVELYTIQHDVPQRFEGPRRCGALVIWLRAPGPEERARSTWWRWAAALGALGATVLLTR
jgi:hypothetical protein